MTTKANNGMLFDGQEWYPAPAPAPAAKSKPHVIFDDREYLRNHGAKPRGRGRWAFSAKRSPDVLGKDILWSPYNLLFSDAKMWARLQVQSMGGTGTVVLYVQP
jgi:hypothetical protein